MDATVSGFDDNAHRFDQLALVINEVERLLGVPFPSPSVTMMQVSQVIGGFCGANQPSYAPRYIGDPHVMDGALITVRVDEECTETFATIAHEAAHTWFHGSDLADWIDEGLANAIEAQVVQASQETGTVYPPITYCGSYRNISELERGNPERISDDSYTGFSCNYTLGDGIFGALREHHGEASFNERIAALARQTVNHSYGEHTVDDIRRVLGDSPQALGIISRWYQGQPVMRKYRHLDAVDWTFPPTIDGEYLHFSGKIREPGLVHNFVLGSDPYCSQFSLYGGVVNQEWVASVSDPLLVGYSYRDVPTFVVVHDSIDPGTGEFSVTARINDPTLSEIPDLSLLVESRVEIGENNLCSLGDNYSQVAVSAGVIPEDLKMQRHYHSGAIRWTEPPTLSGTTLKFAGVADPGIITLRSQDDFCGQLSLYERDESGYHRVASLAPLLPDNLKWTNPPAAELVKGWTYTDGKFNATARLSPDLLTRFGSLILVVRTAAALDQVTRQCGESEVLSAIDIQRN